MPRSLFACVLVTISAGCAADPGGSPEAETEALSSRAAVPYSAGYALHDDGVIAPYCPVVLVAPDVAVTARRYLLEASSHLLSVHFDSPEGPRSARVRGEIQQPGDDPVFTALLLEEAIADVPPARPGSGAQECGQIAAGYEYVPEGEPVERYPLTGCVAEETAGGWMLDLDQQASGCHYGDGAGVYDADSHVLLGLAGGVYADPGSPCVTGLEVVGIEALAPFLSELSQ